MDLFSRIAACFKNRRKQDQVLHKLLNLLAQRVVGIALGYEDLTDHDSLPLCANVLATH
ncbi:MAG: transposase [Rhodospirillum sp.]|nr:transposase [Rhodospirillum sp.]MCF8491294.1 transposase [Rhodospirillum sp.]MCF8501014.1 transposase [Rhodospirillum sp.]